LPKIVQEGHAADASQAIRRGLIAMLLVIVPVGAGASFGIRLLFGHRFAAAFPVTVVLLVAALPLAGVSFFSSIYIARNRIGAAGLSEIVALAVTVPGLILLAPRLGAMGAAIVSLAAYSLNFTWLVLIAARNFGGHAQDYVIPRRGDWHALDEHVGRRALLRWLAPDSTR
jgi:O-antigen/teichoic acid export membrane protein